MQIIEERMADLDAFVRQSMADHLVQGAQLALIRGGALTTLRAYGTADPTKGKVMTTDTHMEAASLTKPVFSYLLLGLMRQGRLRLDQPLGLLPGKVPTEDARFADVTGYQILTHATGLPGWGEAPLPLTFAPGEGFLYSGKAYTYLQNCVETITSCRLDLLLQEQVFNPLGMDDATMIWTGPLRRTYSRGFDASGQIIPERPSNRHVVAEEPNAAFSLYISATDYSKFLLQLLSDQEALDQIQSVTNPVTGNISWGLGWGLYDGMLWHWGDNDEFKSFVMLDPVSQDAFLMHTNSFNGLEVCYETLSYLTSLDLTEIADMVASAE